MCTKVLLTNGCFVSGMMCARVFSKYLKWALGAGRRHSYAQVEWQIV